MDVLTTSDLLHFEPSNFKNRYNELKRGVAFGDLVRLWMFLNDPDRFFERRRANIFLGRSDMIGLARQFVDENQTDRFLERESQDVVYRPFVLRDNAYANDDTRDDYERDETLVLIGGGASDLAQAGLRVGLIM